MAVFIAYGIIYAVHGKDDDIAATSTFALRNNNESQIITYEIGNHTCTIRRVCRDKGLGRRNAAMASLKVDIVSHCTKDVLWI